MGDRSLLELLDIYQEMVEKQDEIIRRLAKITARMAADLQLLKNDRDYSNMRLDAEVAETDEALGNYEKLKSKLEP